MSFVALFASSVAICGCQDYVCVQCVTDQEMHNSYNQFYSTVFCLLYMFRTNLVVHHQERGKIYCITQFGLVQSVQSCCKHDCTDCTKLCWLLTHCNMVHGTHNVKLCVQY